METITSDALIIKEVITSDASIYDSTPPPTPQPVDTRRDHIHPTDTKGHFEIY